MMGRTITGPPVARFSSRPADRPRPCSARAAGNLKPKPPKVSAATVAKANAILEREALLDQAIHGGVIGSGLRDHYSRCYDADPEGTRAFLRGVSATQAAAQEGPEDYPDTYLSGEERRVIAASREGKRVHINGGM